MGGGGFPWGPLVALTAVTAPNLRPIRHDIIVPEAQCNCTCPASVSHDAVPSYTFLIWGGVIVGSLGFALGLCLGCASRSLCRTGLVSGKGKGRLGQPSSLKLDH